MVDFGRGIYTKEFEYTDNTGVVQKLLLKPLKGKDYKSLMSLIKKFNKVKYSDTDSDDEKNKKFLEAMDEETVSSLHNMVLETLKNSYPTANVEDLELFTSCHLMEMFPIVIELNLGGHK